MPLNQILDHIEALSEQVSAALMSGDAPALEHSSTAMRQAVLRLVESLGPHAMLGRFDAQDARLTPDVRERIVRMATILGMQRDHVARVSAVTDQQLASLFPQKNTSATYEKSLGQQRSGGALARSFSNPN